MMMGMMMMMIVIKNFREGMLAGARREAFKHPVAGNIAALTTRTAVSYIIF